VMLAKELTLEVSLYQDGIIRVIIYDDFQRFKISDELGIVQVDTLYPVDSLEDLTTIYTDKLVIKQNSDDGIDSFEYIVMFDTFQIEQNVNGVSTMKVNSESTLFYENASFFHSNDPRPRNAENEDCLVKSLSSRMKLNPKDS